MPFAREESTQTAARDGSPPAEPSPATVPRAATAARHGSTRAEPSGAKDSPAGTAAREGITAVGGEPSAGEGGEEVRGTVAPEGFAWNRSARGPSAAAPSAGGGSPPSSDRSDDTAPTAAPAAERRNLATLAGYVVALRVSWIFKTESVVMPALLDTLTAPLLTAGGAGGTAGGAGWVQGFLPLLNRAGQSVPPLLYADSLRDRPLKKWSVWATTLGMAAPFAALSGLLWALGDRFAGAGAVVGFLALYALFFTATGLNQLGFSTLQAKLIPPARRGRLIAAGGVLGSVAAVSLALGFLAGWRAGGPGSFAALFAATAGGMVLSSGLILFAREEPDEPSATRALPGGGNRKNGRARRFRPGRPFAEAAAVLRTDPDFRRVAAVAVLFVTAQLAFPHYIVLARRAHGAGNLPLILFVAAQNVGAGLFSVAVGWVADRRGNRLAVRGCLAGIAALPPLALVLTRVEDPRALAVLFFLLGLTPVTFKAVTNWTLELTAAANHPRYVSTLKLCMAGPFLLAVPVGAAIDAAGHGPVFGVVSLLVACGCGLTFLAPEPRRWPAGADRKTTPRADAG